MLAYTQFTRWSETTIVCRGDLGGGGGAQSNY